MSGRSHATREERKKDRFQISRKCLSNLNKSGRSQPTRCCLQSSIREQQLKRKRKTIRHSMNHFAKSNSVQQLDSRPPRCLESESFSAWPWMFYRIYLFAVYVFYLPLARLVAYSTRKYVLVSFINCSLQSAMQLQLFVRGHDWLPPSLTYNTFLLFLSSILIQ